MSNTRHPPLTPHDERWLTVRTMAVRCEKGVRTTSATVGWHRLILAASGVLVVRTPNGDWSTPSRNAVWLPEKVKAELEVCSSTQLQMVYLRASKNRRSPSGLPTDCRLISLGSLLAELVTRTCAAGMLDRRVAWQDAIAKLMRHEIAASAKAPLELVWPRDERAARIAAMLQEKPGDDRKLEALCRRQGASPRTIQRLFPRETGLSFEQWRTRARILRATQLLAEGKKVSTVATACGYQGASAFVAAFKRETGLTPRRYCEGRSGVN